MLFIVRQGSLAYDTHCLNPGPQICLQARLYRTRRTTAATRFKSELSLTGAPPSFSQLPYTDRLLGVALVRRFFKQPRLTPFARRWGRQRSQQGRRASLRLQRGCGLCRIAATLVRVVAWGSSAPVSNSRHQSQRCWNNRAGWPRQGCPSTKALNEAATLDACGDCGRLGFGLRPSGRLPRWTRYRCRTPKTSRPPLPLLPV